MKQKNRNASIKMLPIERIHILNPRARNKRIFYDMAENISKVGLKRPITVTPSKSTPGKDYDLVCGQGRIEAFQACGQTHIPAIVINATEEEALIMSLVENLARKQRRAAELLQGIEMLQQKGYDVKTIAQKIGLSETHVQSFLNLLARGEERLIAAVEYGQLPLNVAVCIMDSPDDEQKALREAYESKQLRGKRLLMAKKLLEIRKQRGKAMKRGGSRNKGITSQEVLKIYQKEVDRKQMLTRKASNVNTHMLFIVAAMRRLVAEENFLTLLKAEGLITMPAPLSQLLEEKR